MPRKRTISDEALLAAALAIVHADGPEALSFAALAARSGLAGSTLVQRFGSRPAMLRAALGRAWDDLDARTAAADAAAGDGAAGVVELLLSLTGQYAQHDYADQLMVLREDLRDPALRARGAAWIAVLETAVERRLGGAPVGTLVVAQWQGALTVWGFTQSDRLDVAIRSALTGLLDRIVP